MLSSLSLNARLLRDTATLKLVKQDIDYIYNLQFKNARDLYVQIVNLYPGHPIAYLLNGMITYWQNYPLLHTSPSHIWIALLNCGTWFKLVLLRMRICERC